MWCGRIKFSVHVNLYNDLPELESFFITYVLQSAPRQKQQTFQSSDAIWSLNGRELKKKRSRWCGLLESPAMLPVNYSSLRLLEWIAYQNCVGWQSNRLNPRTYRAQCINQQILHTSACTVFVHCRCRANPWSGLVNDISLVDCVCGAVTPQWQPAPDHIISSLLLLIALPQIMWLRKVWRRMNINIWPRSYVDSAKQQQQQQQVGGDMWGPGQQLHGDCQQDVCHT